MVKDLRAWLKEDPENVIVDRLGHSVDLTGWYTEFDIKNIWVVYTEDEHKLNSVSVKPPENRAQRVRFFLTGLDHTEECEYNEESDLLQISFG